jgi:guanylate kinase
VLSWATDMDGKLVLIIGPSGVGKSAIFNALKDSHPEFHFPRSATTRARREGENDDVYHFVSDEEFDQMASNGDFLETAVIHENARYGTLISEIIPAIENSQTVIREVDVQGFDSIRSHNLFASHSPYTLQSIFILPEYKDQLIERITSRAPISDKELAKRIESMEKEMKYADLCDARVINKDEQLEEAVKEVEQVIMSS